MQMNGRYSEDFRVLISTQINNDFIGMFTNAGPWPALQDDMDDLLYK